MERKKVTIQDLMGKKKEGKKITMLTAYDFAMASFIDQVGIDMILVGDSAGMVVLGYESTVPVTMDEMIHHCKAVRRGVRYAFLVGDMPFMSYNISREEAIRNAGRFMKEAGCDAVKLEGGLEVVETVKRITLAGIPVMAHIGLTPQTAGQLGGFRVQGKDAVSAQRLLDSAQALEEAGACSIVIECIPDKLAGLISQSLKIPTIGIGAGPACDGQVLVTNDLLGLFERFTPKFVKQYIKLFPMIKEAVEIYKNEVETGKFPGPEHTFVMEADELSKIMVNKIHKEK
ncbi:MAG: 3-methyl-2-oxobutanoate hydroxymethyltransferase [Deltaproteobacteria bacterium RBG_13_43_22]|nr:MAG: 3-methyl-2-oxobutanoate hydroxymethyltransferase [Deltaproteobacteria bacterium RBG_13_43_22]